MRNRCAIAQDRIALATWFALCAALIAALVALIVSLLLVGVVSNTMLRHVIQVAPPTAVLGLALARTPWVRFAAAAVFLFWLLIMS